MRKPTSIKTLPLILAVALVAIGVASFAVNGHASATSLGKTLVRLDRLGFGATGGGEVCAQPSSAGAGTEGKVVVTLPTNSATNYSLGSAASMTTTGYADPQLGASAWPSISSTPTSAAAGVITWTSGDLTATSLYCFTFVTGITNANNNTETAPGNVQTQTAAAAPIDTGNYSEGLAPGGANFDQIAITNAVVPPTFTFALNFNADAFQTNLKLNSWTATSATARTATVTTNAANGYIIWAKDFQNNGGKGSLKSATANAYITPTQAIGSAAHTYSVGAADYGLAASVTTNGSATATVNAAYVSTGGTTIGVLDPTTFEQVVAATTPTASDVVQLVEQASAATTTKAANDYADTITFVGAGMF